MHDGWSGPRVNDDTNVKLSSVGWCLMLVFDWALCGPLDVFFSFDYLFFVSSYCVSVIRLFLCDDVLHKLSSQHAS